MTGQPRRLDRARSRRSRTASLAAALRWPQTFTRTPLRWIAPLAVLLFVLALAFADVLEERAGAVAPAGDVDRCRSSAIRALVLWEHVQRAHRRAAAHRLRLRPADPGRAAGARDGRSAARACAQRVREPVAADGARRHARVHGIHRGARAALPALPALARRHAGVRRRRRPGADRRLHRQGPDRRLPVPQQREGAVGDDGVPAGLRHAPRADPRGRRRADAGRPDDARERRRGARRRR